ncbi:hypothetical protein [Nocardia carnea]|uniref:hypothetical protein n=1 Tax=Nocardia carnea TaxID=37328 RepID=UPI00245479A3|nr:hypothetical protein [Nocardia carnea]
MKADRFPITDHPASGRVERLNRNHWTSLIRARVAIANFKHEHNHRHWHSTLGYRTSAE